MRPLILAALLSLPLPAAAQTVPEPPETRNLMEEGAKLFFRGLMDEMQPALDDMDRMLAEIEPALRQMGPALHDLVTMIEDVANYEAPVRMPNGDILIRRKPGAPPLPAPAPENAPDAPAGTPQDPPGGIDL
jgi:hypothetical protein